MSVKAMADLADNKLIDWLIEQPLYGLLARDYKYF